MWRRKTGAETGNAGGQQDGWIMTDFTVEVRALVGRPCLSNGAVLIAEILEAGGAPERGWPVLGGDGAQEMRRGGWLSAHGAGVCAKRRRNSQRFLRGA